MHIPRNAFVWLAVLLLSHSLSYTQSSAPQVIGSSINLYSTLLPEQNQVAYEPALNAVTFIHRPPLGTPSDSFGLVFNRSLDGGATWSADIDLTPSFLSGGTPPIEGNRFPSIGIYNPPGNTDPNMAYAVASCPVLHEDSIWKKWGYIGNHSGRLTDGSANCEQYITNNVADPELSHPYSIVSHPNGEMWSMSFSLDTSFSPLYDVLHINKGVWNTTTQCMDWSIVDSIVPDFLYNSGNIPIYYSSRSIAFGPSGLVGYMVFPGAETTSVYCNTQPIVHKTIDGGATWNRLPDFDFRTLPIFNYSLPPSTCPGHTATFSSIDITVDANDRLHLLSEVLAKPDCPCSVLTFTEGEPDLVTLSTVDGLSWAGDMIDSTLLEDGLAGGVSHFATPNIARTADGKKVFYSWARTDPAVSSRNDQPDVWIRGFDVDSGTYTDPLNLTAGTVIAGKSFYPTMAPIVMESGSTKDYEVALVCSELGTMPYSSEDLNPPTYYFLGGAGLDSIDFRVGSIDTTISDSTSSGLITSASEVVLEITPNPVTAGNFVLSTQQYPHYSQGLLKLTDFAGRLIYQMPIALKPGDNQIFVEVPQHIPHGIYFVGVQTNDAILSRSIIIK